MALVLKDRVKETTTTTGTGTVTLAGASTGYQSFSVIGNANTTYYCIAGQGTAEWEVGIGTYTASGTTLSRDTILASSNSGSVVTFSAGTKDVFVVYPAGKSVNQDASGNVGIGTTSPTAKLHTVVTDASSVLTLERTGAGATSFTADFSGAIFNQSLSGGADYVWKEGGTEWMRLTNTGNLGIGTTSPTNKLTVDGNANITGNTTLGDATTDTVTVNGYVGVGGGGVVGNGLQVVSSALSGVNQTGVYSALVGTSGGTNRVRAFLSFPASAAASYTVNDMSGFWAADVSKGAGSTITNLHGLYIADQTQGTNNYGITSLVSSGANKWNIYASGTAKNYFAGDVEIGWLNASAQQGTLTLRRYRDDLADGAGVGIVNFKAGTADTTVAAITVLASGTSENAGTLTLSTATGGSLTERLRIDSSGNVGIGTTSLTGYNLRIVKNSTGATTTYGLSNEPTVQSDVTGAYYGFFSAPATAAAAFTLGSIRHFEAFQSTIGASSAVTNQYGFLAGSSLTGATNNYGFYSNIASSANRYNFYAAGTAENYFAGNVGIGAIAGSTTGQLRIAGNGSGATTFNGISVETSIQSGVTSAWRGLLVRPTTQATAFTLSNLYGVYVNPQTFGAGSTVTNQFGFHAESTLTGATNNYGFYSNIASGTGRWNFYANGTADNYFAGNVGIGTSSPSSKLEVYDATSAVARVTAGTEIFEIRNTGSEVRLAVVSADPMTFRTSNVEAMRIDSSGNVGIGTSSPTSLLTISQSSNGAGPVIEAANTYYLASSTDERVDFQGSFYQNDVSALRAGGIVRIGKSGDYSNNANASSFMAFLTRNAGTLAEKMRIDSSGNLGLGVTPSAWSTGKALEIGFLGNALWGNAADEVIVSQNAYYNSGWKYATSRKATHYSQYDAQHRWFTAPSGTAGNAISWTQAMTLDSSGNLLVGKTSTSGTATGVIAYGSGAADHGMISVARGSNATMIEFRTTATGNIVGQISQDGTNTTYSTSSDYRLKHDIQPMIGALAKVSALKPVTYKWNADDSDGEGFIAHELAEVCPHAVTGAKDAVDVDGNPVYQGVDTSFLVATLTAAIKEQQAIIETLKARLDAAGL